MKKVNQAMDLFKKCGLTYQTVILHASGCGEAHCLGDVRKHFGTLDLLDELDTYIEEMTDDIEHSNV